MVEVGKPCKRILHQECKTATRRRDVLHPQRVDRVLAHVYPGSPPLARVEHVAEVGVRDEELCSACPSIAFKKVNVGEFEQAAVDCQHLREIWTTRFGRSGRHEPVFVVLCPVHLHGLVVDVHQSYASLNGVLPYRFPLDGRHDDDRLSPAGLTHDRQRACRVRNTDRRILNIELIFLQNVHPVGIIPPVVRNVTIDRCLKYSISTVDNNRGIPRRTE